MKTWYKAVCDKHKEFITIFVSNPSATAHYLADADVSIQAWLEMHTNCKLRLIHRDADFEEVVSKGYRRVDT